MWSAMDVSTREARDRVRARLQQSYCISTCPSAMVAQKVDEEKRRDADHAIDAVSVASLNAADTNHDELYHESFVEPVRCDK